MKTEDLNVAGKAENNKSKGPDKKALKEGAKVAGAAAVGVGGVFAGQAVADKLSNGVEDVENAEALASAEDASEVQPESGEAKPEEAHEAPQHVNPNDVRIEPVAVENVEEAVAVVEVDPVGIDPVGAEPLVAEVLPGEEVLVNPVVEVVPDTPVDPVEIIEPDVVIVPGDPQASIDPEIFEPEPCMYGGPVDPDDIYGPDGLYGQNPDLLVDDDSLDSIDTIDLIS